MLTLVPTPAASSEWEQYLVLIRELADLERDPTSTSQHRADVALRAHRAWEAFRRAFLIDL